MRSLPGRFPLPLIVLMVSVLLATSTSGRSSSSKSCELVLSLPRTVWQTDERIVATLVLQSRSSISTMVVKAWLPSGWTLRRQYLEGSASKSEERSGGIMRGVTGEFYTARRQPDEYATIVPQESLKVEEPISGSTT